MKKLFFSIFRILLFLLACFIILINYRPDVPQLEKYAYHSDSPPEEESLTVQFIGNTNIMIRDGETAILTDGFFTRPSVTKVLWGEVEPDKEVIQSSLKQARIQKLDAVIPVHSHFDHAMDSPIVAQMTGAKLVGSESTLNIGRGLGFPEDQMIKARSGLPLQFGSMRVTLIKGKHWPYPDKELDALLLNSEIEEPIIPPISAMAYKEGASYTIIVAHPEVTLAVHGSAGFIPHILDDFDVDILFLGLAGLETMDASYNDDYQTHVTDALNPEVIVPIHWDDFFVPLKKGIKSRSLLERWLQGMDVKRSFELVEDRNPKRQLVVLPLWDNVFVSSLRGL